MRAWWGHVRLSLGRRFVLVLVPVAVGATVGMGIVGHVVLERQFDHELRSNLDAQLLSRVLPLTTRLHTLNDQLTSVAGHLSYQHPIGPAPERPAPGDWIPSDEVLRDAGTLLRQWTEVDEVFLVVGDDRVRYVDRMRRGSCRRMTVAEGEGPDWVWSDTRADGGARVVPGRGLLDIVLRRGSGDSGPTLWISKQVPGPAGAKLGVVLRSDLFDSYLGSIASDRAATALLTDLDGHLLASRSVGTPMKAEGQAALARLLPNSGDIFEYSSPSEDWVVVTHLDRELGITAAYAVSHGALTEYVSSLRWSMLILLVAAVVLSWLAIRWVTRSVVRPVEAMVTTMESVSTGDLTQRVDVVGSDEIGALGHSFNVMITDLQSTQVALEEQSMQLADALEEVESVEAMKDSFLALVSHEVRTPLTSIMGGVEFLRDEFGDAHSETETEFMGIVYESARRLAGFMNDAIMMASLQARNAQSGFEPFSMHTIVQTKIDSLKDALERDEIEFRNFLEGQSEFFVRGDWTLMQVAVQKVLENAIQHNRHGGRVEVEFVDRVREDEDGEIGRLMTAAGHELPRGAQRWGAIRVFNTGPLIPEDRMAALFERFELTHDIENHQRGSGLSLPIAHYVLEYHGGALLVRGVGDQGMAFYLALPGQNTVPRLEGRDAVPDGVDETVAAAHLVSAAAREVEEIEAEIQRLERMGPPADLPIEIPEDFELPSAQP